MSSEELNKPTAKSGGPLRAGRLLANALSNYLRFGVMMGGMLLLTPYIISNVGRSDFGLWMLVLSVVGYFELLDCGFATATVKFIGQYQGANDTEARNKLASTLLTVYISMAAVISLLAVGLTFSFNWIFQIENAQQQTAILVLLAMSLKVAFNLPLSLFLGILFGQQRIVAVNITRVVAYISYALCAWWALANGHGIVQLAALNCAIFVIEHLVFYVICRIKTPDLKLNLTQFDRSTFWKVASFSIFALVTNLSAVILLRTDPIVVKFFLPLTAVALYALSLKIAEQVLMLTKQFINVFTPLVAQLHGAGDRAGLREAFLGSSKFGLASLSIISIPLMYWSSEAMELWIGPEFAESGPILALLIGSMHFRVLEEGASNVLGMTGEHRYVALTSVGASVLNVGLSLLLIWPFGLLGVATATAISTYIVGVWIVVGKMRSDYGISGIQYCRLVPAPIVFPAAFQLVVCAYLRSWRMPTSLWELALYFAVSSLVFLLTFCLFSISSKEHGFIERRFPRLSRLMRKHQPRVSSAA